MKTTPWIPPDRRPVRKGIYQVLINSKEKWSRWDGSEWKLALPDFERAAKAQLRSINCYQPGHFGGWRGLSSPPKEKQ